MPLDASNHWAVTASQPAGRAATPGSAAPTTGSWPHYSADGRCPTCEDFSAYLDDRRPESSTPGTGAHWAASRPIRASDGEADPNQGGSWNDRVVRDITSRHWAADQASAGPDQPAATEPRAPLVPTASDSVTETLTFYPIGNGGEIRTATVTRAPSRLADSLAAEASGDVARGAEGRVMSDNASSAMPRIATGTDASLRALIETSADDNEDDPASGPSASDRSQSGMTRNTGAPMAGPHGFQSGQGDIAAAMKQALDRYDAMDQTAGTRQSTPLDGGSLK